MNKEYEEKAKRIIDQQIKKENKKRLNKEFFLIAIYFSMMAVGFFSFLQNASKGTLIVFILMMMGVVGFAIKIEPYIEKKDD